jgi:hypothetical protein
MISLFGATTMIASFFVFVILLSPLFSAASIQAQAQTQAQDKLFIFMKINNPRPSIGTPNTFYYDVYNMTTNLNKK